MASAWIIGVKKVHIVINMFLSHQQHSFAVSIIKQAVKPIAENLNRPDHLSLPFVKSPRSLHHVHDLYHRYCEAFPGYLEGRGLVTAISRNRASGASRPEQCRLHGDKGRACGKTMGSFLCRRVGVFCSLSSAAID